MNGRKYLQNVYLIKDLNPEEVKNIYNSISRNPTTDKKKKKSKRNTPSMNTYEWLINTRCSALLVNSKM